MADMDLATALGIFKSGMQDLAFTRALGNATDQVQQIKQSELSDQEQRQQLSQVAQHLTMQMAGIGVPATTMEQVSGQVAPPTFKDANAMYQHGLLTGNQNMQTLAQKQWEFENQDDGSDDGSGDLAREKFQETYDNHTNQLLDKYNQNMDSTRASSRSAFGAGALALQKASRVQALMGDPSHWGQLTDQDMTLVAEGLSNVAKGGVATKEEMEALVPGTSGSWSARWRQWLSNNPTPASRAQFAAKYSDLLERETNANKLETLDTMLARAKGSSNIAARGQMGMDQYKMTTAAHLQKLGINVAPDDIQVTPGKGVSIPKIDQANQDAESGATLTKKAFTMLKSPDKEARAKAVQWLGTMGISPTADPNQSAAIVRKRLQLKVFE